MADDFLNSLRAGGPDSPVHVVLHHRRGWLSRLWYWLVFLSLLASVAINLWTYRNQRLYFAGVEGPTERFHSGNRQAADKLAIIRISGTISPPFTHQILNEIRQAKEDNTVRGVLLAINSPGGLVADSHQIHHRLRELSVEKPVIVSFGSLAASGGYYVAMGAGPESRIFAEPTTWTGSIGVIIPHYEVTGLAEKLGVEAVPLKTGEFKDALSPFRPMTDRDREVWDNILNQAFEQFIDVIDQGRPNLDAEQVRALATGQIYTARDARENGLVDELGYEEDALDALRKKSGLSDPRIVEYEARSPVWTWLIGLAPQPAPSSWPLGWEGGTPRALYLFAGGASALQNTAFHAARINSGRE